MKKQFLPYQLEFLQAKAPIVMMSAARGTGKTVALGYKVVQLISEKKSVLACTADYKMLKFTVFSAITDALDECNIRYKYNKSEMTIKCNGVMVYGISAEAYNKARGLSNITALVVDEAAMCPEEAIPVWSACLRGKDVKTPEFYFLSTPKGTQGKAKWFYEAHLKPTTISITAKTKDNYLLSADFYESMREIYGDTEFADQELGGEFCTFNAGFLKSKWLKKIKKVKIPTVNICRSYDLAVSVKKSADYTASTLLSLDKSDMTFTIHEVNRYKFEYPDVKKLIVRNALKDGRHVPIQIEAFGQQISIIQDLRKMSELKGYRIVPSRPAGDKLEKAMPFAAQMSLGNVNIVDSEADPDLYPEMDEFTGQGESGTHDDMVDSLAIAYFGLVKQVPGKRQDITGLY